MCVELLGVWGKSIWVEISRDLEGKYLGGSFKGLGAEYFGRSLKGLGDVIWVEVQLACDGACAAPVFMLAAWWVVVGELGGVRCGPSDELSND